MAERHVPTVSVVMPAYNAEAYVSDAITSILEQTYTDFEFIVIDDGSSDRTRAIIASFRDPRLVVIANERNLGLTASLSKGLAVARGQYIARQDADDVSLPSRLERQVRYFSTHPEIGLLGTWWSHMDESGRVFQVVRSPANSPAIREALLTSSVFAHGSVMLRRECVESAGGYQSAAGSAEDLDLWLRLVEKHEVGNVPEQLYRMRVHGASVVGRGLRNHLESVYRVRKNTVQRWSSTGAGVASPATVARCYFLLACQDLLMGRAAQGDLHLQLASELDPDLPFAVEQNARDVASFALWASKIADPARSHRDREVVGRRYAESVVAHLCSDWSLGMARVVSQFLVTLCYDAYIRQRFGDTIRYALESMYTDRRLVLNRGLWRLTGHSAFRHRVVL